MPVRIDGKRYHPLFREAAADLLCAGYGRSQVARMIGVTDWTINFWFGDGRSRIYHPKFIHIRVLELHDEGKSHGQIGYLLGLPRTTVASIIQRNRRTTDA